MPQRGVIKKLVQDRGFGFISREQGGDIFFHHSAVVDGSFDDLQEQQPVEYEVEAEDSTRLRGKGARASSVRPL
jgi:CspA family cold shock protein